MPGIKIAELYGIEELMQKHQNGDYIPHKNEILSNTWAVNAASLTNYQTRELDLTSLDQRLLALSRSNDSAIPNAEERDTDSNATTILDPADNEAAIAQETARLEGLAYPELVLNGVPPCYPIELGYPVPQESQHDTRALEYWETIGSPQQIPLPLDRQLHDWRLFCHHSDGARHFVKEYGSFTGPEYRALSLDDPSTSHGRLNNWRRYEQWHCRRHEELQALLREPPQPTPFSDATSVRERQQVKVNLHASLLEWIADERQKMEKECPRRSSRLRNRSLRSTARPDSPGTGTGMSPITKRKRAGENKAITSADSNRARHRTKRHF